MSVKRKSVEISIQKPGMFSCGLEAEKGMRKMAKFDTAQYDDMMDNNPYHISNNDMQEGSCLYAQPSQKSMSLDTDMGVTYAVVPQHRFITTSISY
eukprot:CFRG2771T1